MRGRHTLAVICGVLCLLLAFVSGCGGSPEPKPPPKAEPSTSPSPSATPPVMPAAAKETTDEGAEAFARHFVEAVNYAAKTGDASLLRSVSSPSCKSCQSIAQRAESTYENGGHIETEGWRVVRTGVAPSQPRSRVFVDLTVRQAPESVVASEGASPQEFKGGLHTFNLVVAAGAQGWEAKRLDLVG